MDRETWPAVTHGVAKSQTWLSDWTKLNWTDGKNTSEYYSIGDDNWTILTKPNSSWVTNNDPRLQLYTIEKYRTTRGHW